MSDHARTGEENQTSVEGLRSSVRSAYIWSFGGNAIRQTLSFGLSLLLARFLTPIDYGLVGMVLVFTGLVSVIQDLGIGRAVVYFRDSDEQLPTYYTASALSGIALAGLLSLSAPLIAAFYASPQLTPIVRWLSLTIVVDALRAVPYGLATRDFRFRYLTAVEAGCALTAASIAVLLAMSGFGVWSLVTNMVLGSALQAVALLGMTRPRFTLRPNRDTLVKILRWGTPLTGSTLLWKFYDNADYLVVGKFAGQQALGIYTLAFRLATLVNEKIGTVITRVSFPTFAALQSDKDRVVEHWLSVTRISALICFPLLALLAGSSADFVPLVLGTQWQPSIAPLYFLCVISALRVLTAVSNSYIAATENTGVLFKYNLLNAIILPVAFVIGCRAAGILGVAMAWIIAFPPIVIYLLLRCLRISGITGMTYAATLRLPLIMSTVVLCVFWLWRSSIDGGWIRLVGSVLTAIIAAGTVIFSTAEGRALLPDPDMWRRCTGRVLLRKTGNATAAAASDSQP